MSVDLPTSPTICVTAPTSHGFWRRGDLFLWVMGSAAGLCVLMILGLLALVGVNGVILFWPRNVAEWTMTDGSKRLGEATQTEKNPETGGDRILLKRGNRDLYGSDFEWVNVSDIASQGLPVDAVVMERLEWGNFIGRVRELRDAAVPLTDDRFWVEARLRDAANLRKEKASIEAKIAGINDHIERLNLRVKRIEYKGGNEGRIAALNEQIAARQRLYEEQAARLESLDADMEKARLVAVTADGQEKEIRLADVTRLYRPNELGFSGKLSLFLSKIWEFVWGKPREANTEGGIFPAIFGTVTMVLLMSVAVVPFGVLAAFFLREYAKQGALIRLVRIAVNNLAGVPSIVYGVFGLGFFIYTVGGGIDRFFYPERLPNPTYGTGGILWASLTLALLTVPSVIVTTEEALAVIPRSWREASYALGATQFQTVWRVLLPAATPGILTGLILAVARGAGEVAPLMITGVVKLAPSLPIDGTFPFLHFNRKFMHLGFHIYDVGFQSPNVEAAKPMVYATTFLLLFVVVALNLSAMVLRNFLRKKYETSQF